MLNIKLEGMAESVIVYSVSGTKLLDFKDTKNIDVTSLSSGIYNLHIVYDGNELYQKFVKL